MSNTALPLQKTFANNNFVSCHIVNNNRGLWGAGLIESSRNLYSVDLLEPPLCWGCGATANEDLLVILRGRESYLFFVIL